MTLHGEMQSTECQECQLTLPLNDKFDLEKAVCSYGFFMMPPNLWLPSSSTLQRPLRLTDGTTLMVCISQPKLSPSSFLLIRAIGIDTLTIQDQQHLLDQVVRMLRLSEKEECAISGFHAVHPEGKAKNFGRIFRSPTLFEDMVKGILLCNCGWGRTLSMARLLCDLQSELKGKPLGWPNIQETAAIANNICVEPDDSSPKTPSQKDRKRKQCSKKPGKLAVNLLNGRFSEQEIPFSNIKHTMVSQTTVTGLTHAAKSPKNLEAGLCQEEKNGEPFKVSKANLSEINSTPEFLSSEGNGLPSALSTGDFPSPIELASLDETFLGKRCGLGYRAKRILKLARDICEGAINLSSLESSDGSPRLHFSDLKEFFLKLEGFGPFTCAIVLMCMGDYQSIPADSETVRHLKQVHGRSQCNIGTVAREVEEVYATYAPFQFLAYWCEIWDCYEKKFGKLSQLPPSGYHLITGNNMRKKVLWTCTFTSITQNVDAAPVALNFPS